ncbi:hypothetical protein [Arthrobacter gengyunqii]|uniref:Uncharacterized protein n=1 Tax=Arthrobacter gengyunqii TaxID=2886940 RepID=A0ABS8GI85_9MICC|nr:hypothetical protein [Arthrobacter gengyunqii]MCC3265898.1 hypothetical protein [Arthrobacter gengyunqii]
MIPAACNDLISADHTDLCIYLNEQIRQVRIQPWITAIISGLIGVVAAGLTAWFTHLGTSKLKKTERFNAGQRQALMDCQDAALELRTRLIEWSQYLISANDGDSKDEPRQMVREDPFPAHMQEELTGRLTAHSSRVNDAKVKAAFSNWADYAQLLHSGSEDHNLARERELWGLAVEASGEELRQLDK